MKKFDLLPDPGAYPESRLFCLDLLRGLDMFYLAIGGAILPPLLKALQCSDGTKGFLNSHPWFGFTMWDLIMPLFIYMAGAAVPFALKKRLGPDGKPTAAYHKHVWIRFAFLWILGVLSQGSLTSFDWTKMSIYSNTLQTIAVGYVVAAYLYPLRNWAVKIAVPVALVVVYTMLIHCFGDYAKPTNLAQKVDLAAWRLIFPAGSSCIDYTEKYGYVWILPSMMFPVLSLCGCYATQILSNKAWSEWRRAAYVALLGAGTMAAGWALELAGVQCVKHIFTSSFTLQAVGWSTLLLAACYVVGDVWKIRFGTGLLLLFGQFALTAYLSECAFRGLVSSLGDRLFSGLTRFFPADWQGVAHGIWFALAVVLVLIIRRRLALGTAARRRLAASGV